MNFASQIGFAMASLATAIITSRALGPGDKGVLALLILTPVVLQALLDLGVEQGLTMTIAGDQRLRRGTVVGGLLAHALVGLLISSIVAIVAPLATSGSLRHLGGSNAILTAVATPLIMVHRDLSGMLCGFKDIAVLSLLRTGSAVVVTCATIVLASLNTNSPQLFFLVFLLGVAGSVVLMAWRLRRANWLSGAEAWPHMLNAWRQVVRTGLHYYGAHISYFAITRLDSVLLGGTRPAFELGLYSNAVNLGEAVWYFPATLSQVLLPYASGRRDRRLHRTTTWLVLAVSLLAATTLAATGWLLIPLLFGEEFADAYIPMLLLLPGTTGISLALIGQMWLLIYGYGPAVHRINFCAAAGAGALWAVAIPRFGLYAAAIVSSLAYCFMGFSTLVLLRRVTRREG